MYFGKVSKIRACSLISDLLSDKQKQRYVYRVFLYVYTYVISVKNIFSGIHFFVLSYVLVKSITLSRFNERFKEFQFKGKIKTLMFASKFCFLLFVRKSTRNIAYSRTWKRKREEQEKRESNK